MGESAVFWPVSSFRRLFRIGAEPHARPATRADAAQAADQRVRHSGKVNRSIGIVGASLEAVLAAVRLARAGADVAIFAGERPLAHPSRNPQLIANATAFAARVLARATACDPLDDLGHAVLRQSWDAAAASLEAIASEAGVTFAGKGAVQVSPSGRAFQVGIAGDTPRAFRLLLASEPFAFVPEPPKNHSGPVRPVMLDPRPAARMGRALLVGKATGGPAASFIRVKAHGRKLAIIRNGGNGEVSVIVASVGVRARSGGWSLSDRDRLAIETAEVLAAHGFADAAFAQVLPPLAWDGGLADACELPPLAIDGPPGIIPLVTTAGTGKGAEHASRTAAKILSLTLEADDEPIRL